VKANERLEWARRQLIGCVVGSWGVGLDSMMGIAP